MTRGRFLVIEGVDGAGKSTQVAALVKFLRKRGRRVVQLREPGGTAIGEQIRSILLDRKHMDMTTETELFLYSAARAQIVAERIAPALARGQDVLCDRFTLSTLVYQAHLGGLSIGAVQAMCAFAMGNTRPDLCVVLDLPVAVSLARRKLRSGGADRMELKQRNKLARMRAGYRKLARKAGYPCLFVDADGTPVEVQGRLQAAVGSLFPAGRTRARRTPR